MSAPGSTAGGPTTVQAITLSAVGTAVCVLPLFLTGALAVQIREELAFGAVGLGVAVAAFRGTSALTAVPLGRLTDRLGARRSLRFAAATAALASAGIAVTARQWWVLVVCLMVGGCANSLGQPAAHRLLMVGVRPERQGLAFGSKQSAQPTAAMIAGLSLPFIVVTVGWRWAFVLGAALAVAVILAVPRRPWGLRRRTRPSTRPRQPLRDRRTILLLAVATGLGHGAASTIPAFFVDSAAAAGVSPGLAGTLLAGASVCSLVVRFGTGWACDRIATGHLRMCAGLVATGAVGLGLLALGRPATMTAGVLIGLAAGWGYNVPLWFSVMRTYSDTPGAITGAISPGSLLGGTLSPIIFGAVANSLGYPSAWTYALGVALLAAVAMTFAARRLT